MNFTYKVTISDYNSFDNTLKAFLTNQIYFNSIDLVTFKSKDFISFKDKLFHEMIIANWKKFLSVKVKSNLYYRSLERGFKDPIKISQKNLIHEKDLFDKWLSPEQSPNMDLLKVKFKLALDECRTKGKSDDCSWFIERVMEEKEVILGDFDYV